MHGAHRDERLHLSVFPVPATRAGARFTVVVRWRLGRDIAGEVSIEGHELLASEALTDTPWLEVPIGVYVHHPDYENLSLTYKLRDGQLKLRHLKLKKR